MVKSKLNPRTVYRHCDGESGRETCTMSGSTARDLSMGGRDAAQYVEAAIRRGDVVFAGDVADMLRMLKSTGGWDDLDTVMDEVVRERTAWIAACDIREMPEMYI
jgi:hypothetical protein